ncbi:MAG TPA: AsmA-like C-terminal region-containing protein [Candidatus Acidoferrum sp.]|nr:AsmA-like C-terminal region-containing protein [Candidatus Acidoferrum sp.]
MKRQSHWVGRKILLIAGLVVVVLIVLANVLAVGIRRDIKSSIKRSLEDRYESVAEIQDLQVSLFPQVHAVATGIVLRYHGRMDIPPLIKIDKLALSAGLIGLLRSPKHVAFVHLEGVQMHVPSRTENEARENGRAANKIAIPMVIDEMSSDEALLEILPREKGNLPHEFHIRRFVIDSYGFDRPSPFRATLINSEPAGAIESEGVFGPWHPDDPGGTPLDAKFSFASGDLGSFRAISGTISSTGKYGGTLDHVDVDGYTETPNFALKDVGNPVALKTHYFATLDGTNGNTYLKSIEVHLLHSTINASGEISATSRVNGRHVSLKINSQDARLEDFLFLAAKGHEPAMRGGVSVELVIDVPAGDEPLINSLSLRGQFGVAGGSLTSASAQNKLDSLSRGGQGQPKNEEIQNVISNLRGRFAFGKGLVTVSSLTFSVPGAIVQLNGTYKVLKDDLDLHGHLLLDVKLSKTTTGAKSFFLKFADSYFKGITGGASVPIKVTGSRHDPAFGLDSHNSANQK